LFGLPGANGLGSLKDLALTASHDLALLVERLRRHVGRRCD
jgi:hypothetical protein